MSSSSDNKETQFLRCLSQYNAIPDSPVSVKNKASDIDKPLYVLLNHQVLASGYRLFINDQSLVTYDFAKAARDKDGRVYVVGPLGAFVVAYNTTIEKYIISSRTYTGAIEVLLFYPNEKHINEYWYNFRSRNPCNDISF